MRLTCSALLCLVSFGCSDPVDAASAAVVYTDDGRTEVFAHGNAALVAVAQSAIAMKVRESFVDETDPADVQWDYTRTLAEAQDLCAGVAFRDQIEPGACSGTLIDEQHILTAGHCMDTAEDCDDYAWVLGFSYASDGVLATLTSDDVYRCGAVVAYFDNDEVDYAVVRLARPVVGHTPAPVRMEASALPLGTGLGLIGHPNGIAMKIDSGGVVTWNAADASYFRGTVDAFNANSGSGTFDLAGNLVGILGGGETDYVDMGGCNVVNVIDPPPTDDGERLTYVRSALEAFCRAPGVVSPLCDCGGGPCVDGPAHDRCSDAEVITAESQVIEDTLVGFAPWDRGSCGGNGPERVYTFTVTERVRWSAMSEGFDTTLYLRQASCGGAEVDCNDDIDTDTNRGSSITATLAPGDYFLFVDAYDGDVSAFTLTLDFAPTAFDAGVGVDAGPSLEDGGGPSPDAGPAVGADAGPGETSGGGCGVAPIEAPWVPGALLLALGALLVSRRRAP